MRNVSAEELESIIRDHELWRKTSYNEGKRAILSGLDLSGMSIIARDLSGAVLSNSLLDGANVRRTNFDGARLSNTSFRGANLYRVNFNRSKFHNTDLTDATSAFTIYTSLNLCQVKGIDKLEHQAPSSVGVDTIEITKVSLSHNATKFEGIEMFLRQCGIGERLLDALWKENKKNTATFDSVFISYSSADKTFSEKLYYALQKAHVRCWYAPVELSIGDRFEYKIDSAIRDCDKLLLICSKNSLNSPWVQREIARALRKEGFPHPDDEKTEPVLLPILLDKFIFEWKHPNQEDILQKLYCDFSGYETSDVLFEERVQSLLKAIKRDSSRV